MSGGANTTRVILDLLSNKHFYNSLKINISQYLIVDTWNMPHQIPCIRLGVFRVSVFTNIGYPFWISRAKCHTLHFLATTLAKRLIAKISSKRSSDEAHTISAKLGSL